MTDERGSAALLTVLLLPAVALVLALAVELGALRLAAGRARAAADLAVLVAVDDQDPAALEAGTLRLAPDADAVAREYFARNLRPLAARLAAAPEDIAAGAEVTALAAGGMDPRDGARYERPTVRLRALVPVRSGALAALVGRAVNIRADATAAAR